MHSQPGVGDPTGVPSPTGGTSESRGTWAAPCQPRSEEAFLGEARGVQAEAGSSRAESGSPQTAPSGDTQTGTPAAHAAALKQPQMVARHVTARWPSAEGQLSPQKSSSRQTVEEQGPRCLLETHHSDGHCRPHPATPHHDRPGSPAASRHAPWGRGERSSNLTTAGGQQRAPALLPRPGLKVSATHRKTRGRAGTQGQQRLQDPPAGPLPRTQHPGKRTGPRPACTAGPSSLRGPLRSRPGALVCWPVRGTDRSATRGEHAGDRAGDRGSA